MAGHVVWQVPSRLLEGTVVCSSDKDQILAPLRPSPAHTQILLPPPLSSYLLLQSHRLPVSFQNVHRAVDVSPSAQNVPFSLPLLNPLLNHFHLGGPVVE